MTLPLAKAQTRWLRIPEVADRLGISVHTVYRIILRDQALPVEEQTLRARKLGRLWRIPASAVEEGRG